MAQSPGIGVDSPQTDTAEEIPSTRGGAVRVFRRFLAVAFWALATTMIILGLIGSYKVWRDGKTSLASSTLGMILAFAFFLFLLGWASYPTSAGRMPEEEFLDDGRLRLRPTDQSTRFNWGGAAPLAWFVLMAIACLAMFRSYMGDGLGIITFAAGGAFLGFAMKTVTATTTMMRLADTAVYTDPVLTLDRQALRLGERLSVHLEQRLPAGARAENVALTLMCKETAEWDRPVSQTVDTRKHVAHEQTKTFKPGGGSANRITRRLEFEIPASAPPTFEADDNRIEWQFKLKSSLNNGDDYTAEFPVLAVLPKLAKGVTYEFPKVKEPESDKGKIVKLEVEPGPAGPTYPNVWRAGATIRGRAIVDANNPALAPREEGSLCVDLMWFTSGSGTQNEEVIDSAGIKTADAIVGRDLECPFEFRIPDDGPISYDGGVLAVGWQVTATLWGAGALGMGKQIETVHLNPRVIPAVDDSDDASSDLQDGHDRPITT